MLSSKKQKAPEDPTLACFSSLEKCLERAKGFEPSTPTLARLCSTPELHPHPRHPRRSAWPGFCPKAFRMASGSMKIFCRLWRGRCFGWPAHAVSAPLSPGGGAVPAGRSRSPLVQAGAMARPLTSCGSAGLPGTGDLPSRGAMLATFAGPKGRGRVALRPCQSIGLFGRQHFTFRSDALVRRSKPLRMRAEPAEP